MIDRFGDPRLLWVLAIVPALALAYVLLQRRRTSYAVRFTNLDLLASVVERTPGWRRHVPAAVFLLAVGVLAIGLARPQATLKVPRDEATVMLVIDVSGSMKATDVRPDRLRAAQESAKEFLDTVPPKFQVGVISFQSTVRVLANPTTDREVAKQAIDGLVAYGGTAMGDALMTGLGIVRPEAFSSSGITGREDGGAVVPDPRARIPATILLLSDGANTVGQAQPMDAAELARQLGVPIYAVALGTQGGTALIPDGRGNERLVPVPPDEATLEAVAERTNARFFKAPSAGELRDVYRDLGSKIGYRSERKDATHYPLAAGLALLLLAGGLNLAWFQRLP